MIAKDDEERVNILHSYSDYETRKAHISKEKTDEFKYPCVYTIVKDGTINKWWSMTKNNGHFGVPKVIWSNGMASPPTIDSIGEYGLTQFSYAIVDDVENLYKIHKCMNDDKFINLMKLCYMSSGKIDEIKEGTFSIPKSLDITLDDRTIEIPARLVMPIGGASAPAGRNGRCLETNFP